MTALRLPRRKDRIAARAPLARAAVAPHLAAWPDEPAQQAEPADAWFAALADRARPHGARFQTMVLLDARVMLTALLESGQAPAIDCMDSAAMAFISTTTAWRLAAADWLEGVDHDELAEWLQKHPGFDAAIRMTTGLRAALTA